MYVLPTILHKLSWLWFLPALFIDSNINYPLLVWSQRRSKGKAFEMKTDGGLIIGQVVMILLWSIPQTCIPDGTFQTSLGPMLATLLFFYGVHFCA